MLYLLEFETRIHSLSEARCKLLASSASCLFAAIVLLQRQNPAGTNSRHVNARVNTNPCEQCPGTRTSVSRNRPSPPCRPSSRNACSRVRRTEFHDDNIRRLIEDVARIRLVHRHRYHSKTRSRRGFSVVMLPVFRLDQDDERRRRSGARRRHRCILCRRGRSLLNSRSLPFRNRRCGPLKSACSTPVLSPAKVQGVA